MTVVEHSIHHAEGEKPVVSKPQVVHMRMDQRLIILGLAAILFHPRPNSRVRSNSPQKTHILGALDHRGTHVNVGGVVYVTIT